MFSRPSSGERSRPSSITRSIRGSFSSGLEVLPPDLRDVTTPLEIEVVEQHDDTNDFSEVEEAVCRSSTSIADKEVKKDTNDTTASKKEETELERKIRKGLKKIEKLDKILTDKIEKEREVKRERFALERDFQTQIQTLIQEKGLENIVGSQQLLSLCAATDLKPNEDCDDDFTNQIFSTQIDSQFYEKRNSSSQSNDLSEDVEDDSNTEKKSKKDKNKTDFIRRNIHLASHFNETVALTDEERKRLEELLSDDTDLLIGENPFSTPAIKDDGFRFSINDQKLIEDIDLQLKEFLSEEEYNSAMLSESQTTVSSMTSTRFDEEFTSVEGLAACGEKVLNEGHDQRNMVQRLNAIEEKLQQLRLTADSPTYEKIDPDLLRSLLNVDSRMTSDSRSICDSVRTNSEICFEGDENCTDVSIDESYDPRESVISQND
ncbi:fibrous sheath-interacting protein 1-like [Clytia hemisphaerica]|uniref:Fibrous sheath-interacting protein 1 n=1 Tax=Clytia hemisphaerica TaxID=252671 RepID=A0A7M5WMN2_9CNID